MDKPSVKNVKEAVVHDAHGSFSLEALEASTPSPSPKH